MDEMVKRIPVFVVRGLGSAVPPEVRSETDIRYADALGDILEALR